jgi:hypothetical protein
LRGEVPLDVTLADLTFDFDIESEHGIASMLLSDGRRVEGRAPLRRFQVVSAA